MFKVFVTGRLVRDANLKKGSSTACYYKNTIAIDRIKKPVGNEPKAIFIDFCAWNYTAKYLAECANKGTMIAIEGDYDIDGRRNKDDVETTPIIKVSRAEVMVKGKRELEFDADVGDHVDWLSDDKATPADDEVRELTPEELEEIYGESF